VGKRTAQEFNPLPMGGKAFGKGHKKLKLPLEKREGSKDDDCRPALGALVYVKQKH